MCFKEKIRSLFKSRRFWAAGASISIAVCQYLFSLDPETARNIIYTLFVWIGADTISKTGSSD